MKETEKEKKKESKKEGTKYRKKERHKERNKETKKENNTKKQSDKEKRIESKEKGKCSFVISSSSHYDTIINNNQYAPTQDVWMQDLHHIQNRHHFHS